MNICFVDNFDFGILTQLFHDSTDPYKLLVNDKGCLVRHILGDN
jgi:hypothetical protein